MIQYRKSIRFLQDKVEDLLLKRYALEKVVDRWKLFLTFFLTISGVVVFAFYWIKLLDFCSSSQNDDFSLLFMFHFFIGLFFFSIVGYVIWKIVGYAIPKFVFLGIVGWIIVSGSMLPDLFVPGSLSPSKAVEKESIIGFPICRYFGVSEKKVLFNESVKFKNIFDILDKLITPYKYFNNSNNNNKNNKISLTREFTFFVFFIFLLDIFLLSSTYKTEKGFLSLNYLSWKKRESYIKISILFLNLSAILLYFLSLNYFFVVFIFMLGFNFFLIKWEIEDNGQNHKIYSRAALFLFLISSFSLSFSEVFLILFLPAYLFISEKKLLLSNFDVITIIWMAIIGSQIAVLFGMITQTVWSGKRLTEKFK